MDIKVKGISWVGNVYQKFETMCLEVEDVVCQETAKYVETQVKTVGSSVKKFYSEVLQDLLPPSPRSEESGLSLEQNAVFGTNVKQIISFEEESADKDSDKCQEQNDEVDICKTSMMVSDDYPIQKRLHPIEMSDAITSGMQNQASLHGRMQKENPLFPADFLNPDVAIDSISPVVQAGNDEIRRKPRSPTKTGLTIPPSPDALDLESAAGKETSRASSSSNLLCDITSSTSQKTIGTSFTERVFDNGCAAHCSSSFQSSLVLPVELHECEVIEDELHVFNATSAESNDLGTLATPYTLPVAGSSWTEPEHFSEGNGLVEDGLYVLNLTSTESNVLSTLATPYTLPVAGSSWTEPERFGGGKSVEHSGLDEGNEIVELAPEFVDKFDNVKLEDSCIVVDPREIPSASPRAGKHRSYKKKIRDALASRARSGHKQEYEQLAIWHEDANNQPNSSSLELSTSHDIGESEWELL